MGFIFPLQLTFPNPQHDPTPRREHGRYFPIALHVPLTFFLPIIPMVGGVGVSAIMPMPEAAVHKHSNLFLGKDKIGAPFYRIIPSPARDPILFENVDQSQLGGLVILRLDLPHDSRPFLLVEHICHGRSLRLKINAEAGIRFRLPYNPVVPSNDIGERSISF